MYQIVASNKFLKDLKLLKKRSVKDFALLQDVVIILTEKGHLGLSKNTSHISWQEILMVFGNVM